jgi:hypothetical protein
MIVVHRNASQGLQNVSGNTPNPSSSSGNPLTQFKGPFPSSKPTNGRDQATDLTLTFPQRYGNKQTNKQGEVLVKNRACGVCHTDLHVMKKEVSINCTTHSFIH